MKTVTRNIEKQEGNDLHSILATYNHTLIADPWDAGNNTHLLVPGKGSPYFQKLPVTKSGKTTEMNKLIRTNPIKKKVLLEPIDVTRKTNKRNPRCANPPKNREISAPLVRQ